MLEIFQEFVIVTSAKWLKTIKCIIKRRSSHKRQGKQAMHANGFLLWHFHFDIECTHTHVYIYQYVHMLFYMVYSTIRVGVLLSVRTWVTLALPSIDWDVEIKLMVLLLRKQLNSTILLHATLAVYKKAT